MLVYIYIVLLALVAAVRAYPTGAPPSACSSMAPAILGHQAFPQSNVNSPYIIETTATGGYVPGGKYNVTIGKARSNEADFKGFMCQARNATSGSIPLYGSFTKFDTSKAKGLFCSAANDAVTHKNPDVVSDFSMEWQAPIQTGLGPLSFHCTVVQQKTVFYVQLKSASFDELITTTTVPPTTVVTTDAVTTTQPFGRPTTPLIPTTMTSTMFFTTTMAPLTDAPDVVFPLPSEEDVEKFKEYFLKWVEYFMMWKEEFENYQQECGSL